MDSDPPRRVADRVPVPMESGAPPAPARDSVERLVTRYPGLHLVGAILVITTALWIAAKLNMTEEGPLWPLRAPAQLTSLWAVTLMALTIFAGSRHPAVEPMFGGLDRAIELHRTTGPTAIGLIVAHLAFLLPMRLAEGQTIAPLLLPFTQESPPLFTIAVLTTYGFFILGAAAYAARLSYEWWRALHLLNGVLFIAALGITLVQGSVAAFEPLRLWMGALAFVGLLSYFHHLVMFRRTGPKFVYRVARIVPREPDGFDFVLQPEDHRMSYAPGKFVFVTIAEGHRWSREMHPFSLSSTPAKREVRLSIREAGDFTRRLRQLPPGHPVQLYGPYGGFTLLATVRFERLVFIGSGIGIAPFLGMLQFEQTDNDDRPIAVFYVVHDREHAAYHDELKGVADELERISCRLWVSKEAGRITARDVAGGGDSQHTAFMICGSARFNADLSAQLRAIGVPRANIFAEGFAFR
jgi:predicted ferric reductase